MDLATNLSGFGAGKCDVFSVEYLVWQRHRSRNGLVIRPQDSVVTIQCKEVERLAGRMVSVMQRPERLAELQVKINAAMKDPAIAEFLKTCEAGLAEKGRGPHIVRSEIIDQARREVVAMEGFTIRGEYKKVSLETGRTVSGFVYSRLGENGAVLNSADQPDNEFRRFGTGYLWNFRWPLRTNPADG